MVTPWCMTMHRHPPFLLQEVTELRSFPNGLYNMSTHMVLVWFPVPEPLGDRAGHLYAFLANLAA